MGCPPVRGDNPRALASGLSYVQVDKHGITILYTYISVYLAHHEIYRAKVGMGGINKKKTHNNNSIFTVVNILSTKRINVFSFRRCSIFILLAINISFIIKSIISNA